MKGRIVAAALLMMVLFAGFSNSASARGWGRGGYYRPHVAVRIFAPIPPVIFPAPVVVGGYYGGYGGGYAYGGRYPAHYGRGYRNGGGYYDQGNYRGQGRGGYSRGSYGPRGRR